MKLAFLFPGQGAQAVGMGRALALAHPEAREVFDEADRILGEGFSRLCFEGPEDELRKTVNTQPALLAHSVAAWRLLDRQGFRPAWTAGHSLGEYSACVAAGALDYADALRLTRMRGAFMYEAGLEHPGAMAAVLGVDRDGAQRICDAVAPVGVVVPANLNAPGQVVISGDRAAVEAAAPLAESLGAKRFVLLEVSGAFHSPLMATASARLAAELDRVEILDARCPVVANVSASPVQRASEIREALKRQVLGAVRWEDSMRWLLAQRADGFVEIGTGRVLRGLLRGIEKKALAWSVGDPESLAEAVTELGAARLATENA